MKLDFVVCCVMICLCEKVGDFNKVVKVYNNMRMVGFVLILDVYNVMIRLYCKEGCLVKVKEVMWEMEMWGCFLILDISKNFFFVGYKLF